MILALASRDLDLHGLMRVIDKQHQSNKLKSLTLVAFPIDRKETCSEYVFRWLIGDGLLLSWNSKFNPQGFVVVLNTNKNWVAFYYL